MTSPPTRSTPCAPTGHDDVRVALAGRGAASRYGAGLLESLGWRVHRDDAGALDPSPALAWANSGAMALTGLADGPPRLAPAPVASCADGTARALRALARVVTGSWMPPLDGAALLGERAALTSPSATRAGRHSVGRSCRLLRCRDGWLALNLARPDDEALLPAWLEVARDADPWTLAERECRARSRDTLVARGRLMGMAVSPAALAPERQRVAWQRTTRLAEARPRRGVSPLVVDLSALWAGPLCGQLLRSVGARVLKLESLERPDGARRGDAAFFDLLNAEKEAVALPFAAQRGRDALAGILARADIVIEASRPRALRQLGIDAEELVAHGGTTWVSISGHGREGPAGDWVAFGDDAAAAAGLLVRQDDGSPIFCGDAIADPLTGLHAALAGLSGWARGGGRHVELSLRGVSASVRSFAAEDARPEDEFVALPPRARRARGKAAAIGADTRRVLSELGVSC